MHEHGHAGLPAIAAALTLTACAGNGQGLDANGRPVGENPGGGPLTADFASIQANVFTPICTVCHAGAGAPQGLRLDAGSSYDLLVGVPSAEVPSALRVRPGDPAGSYLIQKLEGRASVGARMPLGGPYLDSATIAVIRQWISDGAQRAAAAAKPEFTIASQTPAPGDALPDAPGRIVIGFTRELDATRIDDSAVRLSRVSATDAAIPVGPVAVRLSVSAANPAALVVTPLESLAPGRYSLRASVSSVVDIGGTQLQGSDSGEVELTSFAVGAAP